MNKKAFNTQAKICLGTCSEASLVRSKTDWDFSYELSEVRTIKIMKTLREKEKLLPPKKQYQCFLWYRQTFSHFLSSLSNAKLSSANFFQF